MDLEKIYREEDLFPREITTYTEREYGLLFYNENNRDSYDSNHAILFKDKVSNIHKTLEDITSFYLEKGVKPTIYQSITEGGYFESIRGELAAHGYEVRNEENRYMVLCEDCTICPNPLIEVRKKQEWEDAFRTDIFEAAGEPWEIEVARKAIMNKNTLFFAAYIDNRPVGMTYAHVKDGVCRVNYLLVATKHRGKGVARSIMYSFTAYCRENGISNCFLWPADESAERLYFESGFRLVEVKTASRACYVN